MELFAKLEISEIKHLCVGFLSLVMAFGLSSQAAWANNLPPETDPASQAMAVSNPRWSISVFHSGHMTSTNDADGDNKYDAITLGYVLNPNQSISMGLHMNLLTPEIGSRNPTGQIIGGRLSNQRDTGELYGTLGLMTKYGSSNRWGWNARLGEINGAALHAAVTFWRGVHKSQGKSFRTSPPSSSPALLIGSSIWDSTELYAYTTGPVRYIGSIKLGMNVDGALNAGTDETSGVLGLRWILGLNGEGPPCGFCDRTPTDRQSGITAGIYGKVVGYKDSTDKVGTNLFQPYATFTYQQALPLGLLAEVGLNYPITTTVVGGRRPTPNYTVRLAEAF